MDTDKFKVPGWGISGYYKDIYFRSTNELKALIYFNNKGMLNDKLESNIYIRYGDDFFYCDFKIGDVYYEVKQKTYAQDKREKKQYMLIDKMRAEGKDVRILNDKSAEISSISYVYIYEKYINNEIRFIDKSLNYSLVKRLIQDKEIYDASRNMPS
jgi:hypothetical protein